MYICIPQVMLLVLIAVAAATIGESFSISTAAISTSDDSAWRGAAGWIIFVAGVALITEGIVLLLRFLNPKCFNNSYSCIGFGGLVRKIDIYTELATI